MVRRRLAARKIVTVVREGAGVEGGPRAAMGRTPRGRWWRQGRWRRPMWARLGFRCRSAARPPWAMPEQSEWAGGGRQAGGERGGEWAAGWWNRPKWPLFFSFFFSIFLILLLALGKLKETNSIEVLQNIFSHKMRNQHDALA